MTKQLDANYTKINRNWSWRYWFASSSWLSWLSSGLAWLRYKLHFLLWQTNHFSKTSTNTIMMISLFCHELKGDQSVLDHPTLQKCISVITFLTERESGRYVFYLDTYYICRYITETTPHPSLSCLEEVRIICCFSLIRKIVWIEWMTVKPFTT